jgi:hypothetical protein
MQSCNIKIELFTPDKEQLNCYALAFKEAIPKWRNYLGESIYISSNHWEEDGEELQKKISKANLSNCLKLLKKYEALPEKLVRITEITSGNSESLPIYTGIQQISLEGACAILAEAFFGAEVHLLDAAGRILSIHDREYVPQLGKGELHLIDCNDLYDSQVKGRRPDPTFVEITGYAPEEISRSFTFQSKIGKEYKVEYKGETEQTIKGTGDSITVSDLKNIGTYLLVAKADKDDGSAFLDFPNSWVVKLRHSVGKAWKDIRDFTIQYNTFPFLRNRDQWMLNSEIKSVEEFCKIISHRCKDNLFIRQQLNDDPFSFQFMPTEIRRNKKWAKAFCLKEPVNFLSVASSLQKNKSFAIELISEADKYDDTIYPYLPETLRKDLDILLAMKHTERLFHLPDSKEVGESKFNDIRDFVIKHQSKIDNVLKLFPNALQYAPEQLLNNRELILKTLPNDESLVTILSDSLRDDAEVIIAASGKYFTSLKYASKRLREDPNFVKKIIILNGENICFAAEWMRADKEFVLAAARSGARSNMLKYVAEHFSDDEEIMIELVKKNPYCLEKASERLRLDKAFNLKAIDNGAYYRHNIHKTLLGDRDIVLKAMQKHPNEFEHIPEIFKNDREIVLTVISKKGGYGNYIKDCSLEMRDDPEIIKAAVADNDWNIKHASPRLLADRYFLAEIIYDNPKSLNKMPENMQNDPGLRELARRRNEEIGNKKPENKIKKNQDENDDLPF